MEDNASMIKLSRDMNSSPYTGLWNRLYLNLGFKNV